MSTVVWSMKPYGHRYLLERSTDGRYWRISESSDDLDYLQGVASNWASEGFYVRILDREVSE